MKEHVPTLAALMALAMILGFCAYLICMGVKVEGIVGLGVAGGIGALVSGFAPSFSQQRDTSTNANSTEGKPVPNGQKAE